MPAISVIILNWNGREYLKECLDSLALQSFRDFETILLDNGSSDGSVKYAKENWPWVRLVPLPENIGFAEGNNRALRECSGEFIVTLNNDTKAAPGFLAALVAAAASDTRIGMVAAKMVNFYRHGSLDSVGVRVALNGMGHNIGFGEVDRGQYDAPAEVFGPCAGAALYRRAMLDETGFFDPSFFAYYEDVDLAWRGRLAGWRCVTAPGALVYHVHSATSGSMSRFKVYHVQRNKWFVLVKNWPAPLLARRLAVVVIIDIAAVVLALVRGRGGSALKARLDVVRALPRLFRERRKVQGLRKISIEDVERLFCAGEGAAAIFRRKVRE